jgi:hypothetical protein
METARPHVWPWFLFWAIVGAGGALGMVSVIGWLVLFPLAVIGVLVWNRLPASRQSAAGMITGAGALLLFIAWLHRDGPGMTCYHTATGGGCDEHLNPLPWLFLGLVLVAAGFVVQARRRAS